MSCAAGIDSGGTKTKLTRCTPDGLILDSCTAGSGNILSSGYEAVKESLTDVIRRGILEVNGGREECKALCIGAAGAGRETVRRQLEQIVREAGYAGKLLITHDAETALFGGCEDGEGILLIAGTGAICYGRTKDGRTHRASGWGHVIGDEGSAYYIGAAILNAVMRAYDGRGPKTALTQLLLKRLMLEQVEEAVTVIYEGCDKKQEIASLAILIEEACRQKDAVAFGIVEAAVRELAEDVCAVIKVLGLEGQEIKVILQGSVLTNNQLVRQGVIETLCKLYPRAKVCDAVHDAAYGAALKAIQNL